MTNQQSPAISLPYDEAGQGPYALVFLHGIGGNRKQFEKQMDYFSARYQTISMDLRGHGQQCPKPSTHYTVAAMAQDVKQTLKTLNLKNFSIIGHSLGGTIALELAAKCNVPGLNSIVMLDAPLFTFETVAAELQPLSQAFRGPDYKNLLRQFACDYFFKPHDQSKIKEELLLQLLCLPQDIFTSLWDSSGSYDAVAAARECTVPVLFIHSSVPADLELFKSSTNHASVVRVANLGHYLHLEAPQKINALIEEFVTQQQ